MSWDSGKLGFWASIAVSLIVSLFLVSQVMGLIGLATAYHSFFLCMLLGPCFVVMVACVHGQTEESRRTWSRIALAFGIMYATLCAMTYYVQLAVVRTNSLALPGDVLKAFAFRPGSFIFSANMLGYGLMALSTAFLIPVVREKPLRVMLALHGFLFVPTMIYPLLTFPQTRQSIEANLRWGYIALIAWCLIFLPIPVGLALNFKKASSPKGVLPHGQ